MSSYYQPAVSPYFASNPWHLAKQNDLEDELQKAIVEDPEIASKADISVDVTTDGKKVTEIHLVGSVASDKELQRAAEIVSVNTRDEVKIVNELVVK